MPAEFQTDHLISTRWPNLEAKKRTSQIVDFAIQADHRVKLNESKKRDMHKDLARELKTMEYESDDEAKCNWYIQYSHQRIGIGTGGLGNKRTSEDHPNYSIVEIS